MKIRRASQDDIDTLLAMGERFLEYSAFAKYLPVDREVLRRVLLRLAAPESLLVDSGHVLLVAETDGQIVGGIMGALTAPWFAPQTSVASELAWWVSDEYRGSPAGVRLLIAFERWAEDQGAQAVALSDLAVDGDTPVGRLVERMGYRMVERSHVKAMSRRS